MELTSVISMNVQVKLQDQSGKMMTKLTIELTPEQIDEIILQEMKWHYETAIEEGERLMEKLMDNTIKPHEKEDLNDYMKTRDATEYMIRFYSVPDSPEVQAYFDSFKKYDGDAVNTDHD